MLHSARKEASVLYTPNGQTFAGSLSSAAAQLEALLQGGVAKQDAEDRALGRAVGREMELVDAVTKKKNSIINNTQSTEAALLSILNSEGESMKSAL